MRDGRVCKLVLSGASPKYVHFLSCFFSGCCDIVPQRAMSEVVKCEGEEAGLQSPPFSLEDLLELGQH